MSATFGRNPLGATGTKTLTGYGTPANPARLATQTAALTPTAGVATLNFEAMQGGAQIGTIATVYVDNSTGPIPVEIVYPDTGQITVVPAFTQGYYPALTAGLVLQVTAPLIGVLGQKMSVVVQACNFALPQASYGPFVPNVNAGVLMDVGINTGWTSVTPNVPLDAGAGRLFTSLEVDNSAFAGQIAISGTSIDGSAWSVTQLPLQRGELIIPATASGTPLIVTATIPLGGNTNAIIPTRWRVQSTGEQTSYTVPIYMPFVPFSWTSMPVGNTTQGAFPAEPGLGVYLDKISITASGWGSQFNVSLVDTGFTGGKTIFEETFPSGNVTYGNDLGYVSFAKNAVINIIIQNAAAATGTMLISLRGALVPASQNG